ncbi:MAG: PT domain-containing protein [Candidatus Fimadaptatus sp.]
MKQGRIVALLAALALMASGAPALATGLIGSVSGVSSSGDVRAADQGALVDEESASAQGGEAAPAEPTAEPAAETTPEPTAEPAAETTPEPTAEPVAEPLYQLSEQAQALYERIKDETPLQEGWQMQCAGDSVLVLLATPELTVWNIEPESNLMELMWYRDLNDFLTEDEGNPMTAVAPDGSCAVVAASGGEVYLVSAEDERLTAQLGGAPERIVWARDSQSFACITGGEIRVYTLDGRAFVMEGEVIAPVADESEWLNPPELPAALSELMASDEWRYAGTGNTCVLFDGADKDMSCAYLTESGTVVSYPDTIHSTMLIGRSGACPVYDASTDGYALFLSDGSYANVPVLSQISSGGMANPYGWLGDSICVLVQDASSRSSFKLLAANTATGITYTLLTPWEYAETVNGQAGTQD